jgi:hypothetical protein
MNNKLNLTENYFNKNISLISLTENNEIQKSKSFEDLEIIEKFKEAEIIMNTPKLGELNEIEDYNYLSNPKVSFCNQHTQTDNINIDELQKENIALKVKIIKLENNQNELFKLLANITKIQTVNPEINLIKTQLTLMVNRELRQKLPFPFVNILSKYSK